MHKRGVFARCASCWFCLLGVAGRKALHRTSWLTVRMVCLVILLMSSLGLTLALPLQTPAPHAKPQDGLSEADQEIAETYLRNFYGYRPTSARPRRDADGDWSTGLCDKVKAMQRFFGLPPSGELTGETLAVMKKPRCGLSDVEEFGNTVRWTKKTLSYRLAGRSAPLSAMKLHKDIRAAWTFWSNAAALKFRKRNRKEADIVISFHCGDHDDGSPFDGKGGVLAHAFMPRAGIGGDVHFDAEEDWSWNSTGAGLSLLAVAVHEFGHALGLPHSPDPGAVMYPAYNFAPMSELQLSFHDVKDIQHLYGVSPKFASLSSARPPPKTPDKRDPELSFDAVTTLQQEVLFFKDRFMWRKHPQFDETGITLISSLWPDSVPPYLDAVYESVDDHFVLFFKGLQYWRLRQLKLQEGFPKNISELGFPFRIRSVDAALHFREDRLTVFFAGNECWRYNEQLKTMEGSPGLVEHEWPGIPAPIDAAVLYEGFVHFFKGSVHYKYDLGSRLVVSTSPANSLLECNGSDGIIEKV